MKWSSRTSRRIDYSQIVIIVIAILLAALYIAAFLLFAPRQRSADDWVNLRLATRTAVVKVALDKVTTRESEPVKVLYMECTAYSPTVQECDGDPLTTASGQKVRVGGIAADWRVLPCGSIITVQGYNGGNPCTIIDQGGAIKGLKLDVFYWHESEAIQWGRRRNVEVRVLYIPKAKK
jgi:3D (Asp-Asp-Asp) domain-containing protein